MPSVLESLKTKQITGKTTNPQPIVAISTEPQISFCCEKCAGVDFFLPLGSFSPRCKKCSPPVSRHLVGLEFFFDESGDRWQIVRLVDGGEEWVKLKADFTPVFSLR